MAYTTVKELFTAICDSIRKRKGTTEKINHQDIPSEIESIENYYDTFWDNFQDNGNKNNYTSSFYGDSWNDVIFAPKYPLKFVGTHNNTFRNCKITDLSAVIDELDFSNAVETSYLFRDSTITRIPKVIIGAGTHTNGTFAYANHLEEIEELNMPYGNGGNENGTQFIGCDALQEMNVSGTITCTFNAKHSPNITVEDAKNTIMHLADYGGAEDVNLNKFTISFHSDVWKALANLDETGPTGSGWADTPADLGWLTA